MGLMDNLRKLVGIKTEEEKQEEIARQEQARREQIERASLISDISNLANQLNRINSFDRYAMEYSRMSSNELKTISFEELKQIKEELHNRIESETIKKARYQKQSDKLMKAAYTGKPIEGTTMKDLESYQNSRD